MAPFFSIIIPTYNRAHLLPKAIESVVGQSFTDWELIIVDDGSTDNTQETISSIEDDRIRYIYQENSERSAARNNGINNSTGKWICFLDSDDYYLKNHLETFYNAIKLNNLLNAFIVSGTYYENKGQLKEAPKYIINCGQHPARYILETTGITPISVCIERDCLKKHCFIELFKNSYWEDTHLWIRLAIEFPFYQLEENTNVLTEHAGRSINVTISPDRVSDHINIIKNLFENYNELVYTVFTKTDMNLYIDRKYRMFLYKIRKNKQSGLALKIWLKAIIHKPSFYLVSEFPKIFVNKLGFGIHDV